MNEGREKRREEWKIDWGEMSILGREGEDGKGREEDEEYSM